MNRSLGTALCAVIMLGIVVLYALFVITGLSALATTVFLILAVFFRHLLPVTTSLWGYLICSIVFSVGYNICRIALDARGLK